MSKDNENNTPPSVMSRQDQAQLFDGLESIHKAIQEANDLPEMLATVLDTVLTLFDCDQAFVIYPCDPNATSWQMPMARARSEYPIESGFQAAQPMDAIMAHLQQRLLDSDSPVCTCDNDTHTPYPFAHTGCRINSALTTAIRPRLDNPWQFGIHTCSQSRDWNEAEISLFQVIGRVLADGLSLFKTIRELQERETHYSRIVNLAGEGIWYIDTQGRTTFANARMCEILGYSPEEMEGRSVTDFMFEEDKRDFLEKLKSGFRKAPPSYERRYRRKQGDEVWVSVAATSITDEQDNFIAGFGMVTDITEKKRATEALRKLNESLEAKVAARTQELQASNAELTQAFRDLKQAHAKLLQQEKMASIGQLASGIAHEINTPAQYLKNNLQFIGESINDLFSAVHDMLDLLTEGGENTPPQQLRDKAATLAESLDIDYLEQELPRAMQASQEGVSRITGIVGAMMDFAQPSGRQLELLDLDKLIQSTLAITRHAWEAKAEMHYLAGAAPLMVAGLRDELGQALLNLIMNAVDAVSNKGDDQMGKINVITRMQPDWVEIAVEDSGCGIAPEHQQKIFEPFYTTKSVGAGTGQGLAIVYHIIADQHGGELQVSSAPGEGSIFTLRLPAKEKALNLPA